MGLLPENLVTEFRAVASQRLERIEEAWGQLLKGAGDPAAKVLHHELHTLKGESQMIGFGDVNLVCHKLEDLLEVARGRGYAVDEDFDLIVSMAVRFMGMLSRKRIGASLGGLDLPGFLRQIDKVLRESKGDFGAIRTLTGTTAPLRLPSGDQIPPATRLKLSLPAADAFIEYAVARGHRRNRLRAAWHVMRDVVGIHRATIGSEQLDKHRLGAQRIANGLRKLVDVRLDIVSREVTTEVLATVDMALLHLVRNAIDHGIELPEVRAKAGKLPAGAIVITGNLVDDALVINVSDDGRGIDFPKVRERAIELGLIDSASEVPQDRWVEIVTQPGFSTRDIASDISGRGVGLDAVRASVAALGGRLDAKSVDGGGTTWMITLPIPPMTVRGLLVRPPGVPFPIVLEGWTVATPTRTPIAIDIAKVLGLADAGSSTGTVSVLARGGREIALALEGQPREIEARRLVPTGPTGLYEVVLFETREGLVVRPELLLGE